MGTTFSDAEREAMRARAEEVRAEKQSGTGARRRAADEKKLLETIAAMDPGDRAVAEEVHAIVTTVAPQLDPRTWYGMPAWAHEGSVLCFLQQSGKFGTRYSTFGFNDVATLDDGPMWPASFAILEVTDEVRARLEVLVAQATAGPDADRPPADRPPAD